MAVPEGAKKGKRSEFVNMRVEPTQLDVIDTAANLCGKTRTAFMVDAAYQAAEEALLDRKLFCLDEQQWDEFINALDAPPAKNEKLAKLLQTRSPWE
jgi:uncharacterized protein (DUF1778 family)